MIRPASHPRLGNDNPNVHPNAKMVLVAPRYVCNEPKSAIGQGITHL